MKLQKTNWNRGGGGKLTALLISSAFAVSSMAADTFYVATNGVDAVGRGSEESPFETIQYAIDSASSGSTIWVKPGIYDKGGDVNVEGNGGVHTNRVVLKKKVHLKSTHGAAVTHIVGAPDPDTESGVGPKGVRCIVSPNATNQEGAGADSSITGFTLRDGYGDTGATGHNHRSGGFLQFHGNRWIFFSDCVISNCVSYSHGGARGGTFSRCLFANNRVTTSPASSAAGVGNANLIHCMVVGNGDSDNGCAVSDSSTLVNCTVICNRGLGCKSDTTLYNTIVCGNSNSNYGGTKATDSAIGGYPVYSPLDQDYRIVTGSAADGTGNPANLPAGGKPFSVTTGMVEKDFAGNTVDTTAEHIHVGAIQETTGTATEGGILCLDGAFSCNGHCASVAYAQTTNLLTQWRVKFVGTSVSGSTTN